MGGVRGFWKVGVHMILFCGVEREERERRGCGYSKWVLAQDAVLSDLDSV